MKERGNKKYIYIERERETETETETSKNEISDLLLIDLA